MATMMPSSFSTHQPGAVPAGLGTISPEGMMVACLRLRFRHVDATAGEEAAQVGFGVGVDAGGLADGGGDGVTGDVVFGGAEAAGAEDEVGALQGGLHEFAEARLVIADLVHVVEVDAERGQALGDVVGVGVLDVGEEDFGADGDDLCAHAVPPLAASPFDRLRGDGLTARRTASGSGRTGRVPARLPILTANDDAAFCVAVARGRWNRRRVRRRSRGRRCSRCC